MLRYSLTATRPEGKIESFLSDDRRVFTVSLSGQLDITVEGFDETFNLNKDWVDYRGRGLGSPNRLLAAQIGESVKKIHQQLANHFRHKGNELAKYRMAVSKQLIILTSPVPLSSGDLKVIFTCVAGQFPSRPRRAAA